MSEEKEEKVSKLWENGQSHDDLVIELNQDEVLNYIHAHPAECKFAIYQSFDSKKLLDKQGRSGVILLSPLHSDDLFRFTLERFPWWYPFKRQVAHLQTHELSKGKVLGIPIWVVELTRNPILSKYPSTPPKDKRRLIVFALKYGFVGPLPYGEVKFEMRLSDQDKPPRS